MGEFGYSKDALRAIVGLSGEFVGTTDTQILSGKTYSTTDNVLTSTSRATGDILVDNGTKLERFAKGAANLPLKMKSDASTLEYAKLDVAGGGTGAVTLSAGVVIAAGTSAFTTKSNPAGAFIDDTTAQNVSGAKTFSNTAFIQRNPAGTFSLTWIHPAITAAKDHRFYEPYNYLVYKEGSTIYAVNGLTGGVDSSSSTAATVIQFALDNLTASRTQKEIVKVIGTYNLTGLTIPSYTYLDLSQASLTQTAATNTNFLINNDTTVGNTQIEIVGGYIDGNKANQSVGSGYDVRNAIMLKKCTDSSVRYSTILNSNSSGIYFDSCNNVAAQYNTIKDARKLGIYHFAGSTAYKNTWMTDNYISNPSENFLATTACTDNFIERNMCETCGTTGINVNGNRQFIRDNYITGATLIGIALSPEGVAASDDCEVTGNHIYECKTGGIYHGIAHVGDRVLISGNHIKGATSGASTTAYGIRCTFTNNSIVALNKVWNWQAAGITVEGNSATIGGRSLVTNNVQVIGNQCWDNGQNASGSNQARPGISLISNATAALTKVMITDNVCYDSGIAKQSWGLRYINTTNIIVQDNDFRANVSAAISDAGGNTTPTVRRNLGWATEGSGSSTQSGNGSTKVFNIAHGLIAAPTKYVVSPGSADAIGPPYLTSDATNVIVTYPSAPPSGSSNLIFRWIAEVV